MVGLAEDLDVGVRYVDSAEAANANAGERTIVVVAAGGREADGLDSLGMISLGLRASSYLVGATTEHRFGIEAIRQGAADYFALPADADLLRRTLSSRVKTLRARETVPGRPSADAFEAIIGESPSLVAVLDRARKVSMHGAVTVLIGGETGTGKELLARAIHEAGPRAAGPFVEINCAAIPSNLLESELFGHQKGAFTDAHRDRVGLFEEANDGTLFLDEIGHLPMDLQGKLLRALEEKRIRPIGGTESKEVDVRIIAATHVDLKNAIGRGEFREDLFYRLNVVSLRLPALRERGSDLELLADRFVRTLAVRYDMPAPQLSPELVDRLHSHSWPGNVRELRYALERAILLSPAGSLDPGELALESGSSDYSAKHEIPFPAKLREINAAAAISMLRLCDDNKSAAARRLGISRSRLQRLLDAQENGEDDD